MAVLSTERLENLIEHYERHRDHYRSTGYNETRLRVEFIDPLFIAMGWDVRNERGYADAYKEVLHEDAIKVGTATKAPDYSFRVGGVRKFFLETKKVLSERENGKLRGGDWHGFIYKKNHLRMTLPKICVPRLVDRLGGTIDSRGARFLDNVDVCGVCPVPKFLRLHLNYLLGIINSRLLGWFFPYVSAPFRGGWWSANRQFLSQVPVPTINFDHPSDVARYDRMVSLVQQMLDLHGQKDQTRMDQDRKHLQRLIDATDREIDELVYELYDLTDEEIAIVEAEVG